MSKTGTGLYDVYFDQGPYCEMPLTVWARSPRDAEARAERYQRDQGIKGVFAEYAVKVAFACDSYDPHA